MEFLKSSEIKLNAANYLVSETSGKPVTHKAFVQQQQKADYTVRLANAIKDKNFTVNKVDNLESIKATVMQEINNNKQTYVEMPKEPTSKVVKELADYALNFVNFQESVSAAQRINEIMNEFNTINDVESVGDYFQEGVVKLSKIYSIAEILDAVKITVEKLN